MVGGDRGIGYIVTRAFHSELMPRNGFESSSIRWSSGFATELHVNCFHSQHDLYQYRMSSGVTEIYNEFNFFEIAYRCDVALTQCLFILPLLCISQVRVRAGMLSLTALYAHDEPLREI